MRPRPTRAVGAWKLLASLLLALSAASCGSSGSSGQSPVGPGETSVAVIEQQVHVRVNDYRASRGLPPLTWNDVIAQQAREHSRNMADGSVPFGHGGFDARAAALAALIPYRSVAENVVLLHGQADPAVVAVSEWVASPGHRANIEGQFSLTGVGAASSGGTVYVTQIFVDPR